MEFQSHVRSQKNKGILTDRILGLPAKLDVKGRGQKINAPANGEFLLLDNGSIVVSSQRQAGIEC